MIMLDTHVLIWWISNPEKLSEEARIHIKQEIKNKNEILISSISIWEIYMLVKKGRLKLSMDTDAWLERVEQLPFLQFVPIDNRIAAKSVNLSEPLHNDPADRMIIATALEHGVSIVTSDKKILDYPHSLSIW